MAKILFIIAIILLVFSALIYYFEDYFKWIGHLPGDIRLNKNNINIYIPFTSMILISIIITILSNIIRKMIK